MPALHKSINFETKNNLVKFNPGNKDVPLSAGVSIRDYACLSLALQELNNILFDINTSVELFDKYFSHLNQINLLQHANTSAL